MWKARAPLATELRRGLAPPGLLGCARRCQRYGARKAGSSYCYAESPPYCLVQSYELRFISRDSFFLNPNYSRHSRRTTTKFWPQFKRDLVPISSTTCGLQLTGSPCDAGAFRPRCHFSQKRQMLIGSRQDVFRHATDACLCSRRLVPSVWTQLACSESMILASSSAPSSNLAKMVARCGRISSGGQ